MEALSAARVAENRNWFVIYTRPKWEKKVDRLLQQQGIITYCPLRKVKRKWADRIKEVELPLFSCYIFVYIAPIEELKVRLVSGVMNFIYYMHKPAKVRAEVIEEIRRCLILYPDAEVVDIRKLEIGDHVKIKQGIMTEKQGQIIKLQGKNVLLVIDDLNCALITRVSAAAIELVRTCRD